MKASVDYAKWNERWAALKGACAKHGAVLSGWHDDYHPGAPPKFEVQAPASEDDVIKVEAALSYRIPDSFRRVLLGYSAAVDISWRMPENYDPPEPFDNLFCGELYWSLGKLAEIDAQREKYANGAFSDLDFSYSREYHNKLAFHFTKGFDFVAIDLGWAVQPVTYLSYDEDEGHGYHLGEDFEDFVNRMSLLGCPNIDMVVPFTNGPLSFLNPYTPEAHAWREWFGLQLDLPDRRKH